MSASRIDTWKLARQKYIFTDPLFTVREDYYEQEGGQEIGKPYYVVESPELVHVICVTEKNEIVMVRQYRPACAMMSLEFPGGIVEPTELLEDAARREFWEETGYEVGELEPIAALHSNPGRFANRVHFFFSKQICQTEPMRWRPESGVELVHVPTNDLLASTLPPDFINAAHVAAWFIAMRDCRAARPEKGSDRR